MDVSLEIESTRDWGCGGVKKLAARNSKGTGGSFVRHLNRPWHLFDSFFGRVARYGPVSVALFTGPVKTPGGAEKNRF